MVALASYDILLKVSKTRLHPYLKWVGIKLVKAETNLKFKAVKVLGIILSFFNEFAGTKQN